MGKIRPSPARASTKQEPMCSCNKGRTIRKVMWGMGEKNRKKFMQGKMPRKKFAQRRRERKKFMQKEGPIV